MANENKIEIQEVEENIITIDELRKQKAGLESAVKITVSKLIGDFICATGVNIIGIDIRFVDATNLSNRHIISRCRVHLNL